MKHLLTTVCSGGVSTTHSGVVPASGALESAGPPPCWRSVIGRQPVQSRQSAGRAERPGEACTPEP